VFYLWPIDYPGRFLIHGYFCCRPQFFMGFLVLKRESRSSRTRSH
jgi:hypothetical protein